MYADDAKVYKEVDKRCASCVIQNAAFVKSGPITGNSLLRLKKQVAFSTSKALAPFIQAICRLKRVSEARGLGILNLLI